MICLKGSSDVPLPFPLLSPDPSCQASLHTCVPRLPERILQLALGRVDAELAAIVLHMVQLLHRGLHRGGVPKVCEGIALGRLGVFVQHQTHRSHVAHTAEELLQLLLSGVVRHVAHEDGA